MAELKYKNKKQGTLHHQCIDELTSHIRIAQQQQQQQKQQQRVATQKGENSNESAGLPVRPATPVQVAIVNVEHSLPLRSSPATGEVAVIASSSQSINHSSCETLNRNDENVTLTVHNTEVKRKIPPR